MTVDSQAVVDAISAAVVRRVPEWYGAGAVALPAAGFETRRYSFFLRYPVVSAAGSARVLDGNTRVQVSICINVRVHVCICVYIRIYVRICVRVHVHICVDICTCIRVS